MAEGVACSSAPGRWVLAAAILGRLIAARFPQGSAERR
jgi:hypothetical protein